MPHLPPLNVRDYYDLNPPMSLAAGDIWSGLPTHGLISGGATRSIVVTPACDLSNHKVETATYLPVIPVRQYLRGPAFVPVILRETSRHLETAGLQALAGETSRFLPPAMAELDGAASSCGASPNGPVTKKTQEAAQRAAAGISILRQIRMHPMRDLSVPDVSLLLGPRQWRTTVQQVVRNAFRLDLFFLPWDEQQEPFSAVSEPSVVLFRYPLSVPIQILECAQDTQLSDWQTVMQDLRPLIPGVDAFASKPLKHATLRGGFLSDMLTRFASMHVRLGTPDLSEATVEGIVTRIAGVSE